MNGPSATARPAPAWRSVLALTTLELRLAARRAENLLVMVVIPAVVLAFFASVDVLPLPGRPIDFLLPGALALGVVAAAFVNLGIATAYERQYGVLKRLGGAPLPRGAVVIAKILAVLALELVQAALLVAIAWFGFGWRPGPAASPVLWAVALGLGTAAFAGLGLAIAGRLRPELTLAVANGVFVAFVLLGGVIVPVDELPTAVASVASALPVAALADTFRAATGAGGGGLAPFVLAGWALVGVALAIRWFRWE